MSFVLSCGLQRSWLCFIWQLSVVGNYSACCSKHSIYAFSIDSYHALTISLRHRDQTEVSSLKDFPPRIPILSPISVITQRFILSAIDLFVLYLIQQLIYLFYFFYNKDFFALYKICSTSHIARGIIKLIAWTTSFLEERQDFDRNHVINMKCK